MTVRQILQRYVPVALLAAFGAAAAWRWDARSAVANPVPPNAWTSSSGITVATTCNLVKTGTGIFGAANAFNNTGSAIFLMVFDATSQPANATSPIWSSLSVANNTLGVMPSTPPTGIKFNTGLLLCVSSLGFSYQATGGTSATYQTLYR